MHYNEILKTMIQRREALQVTQDALAELAQVGLRTLKQIESGKGNPTINTLQKLLDVLGLEMQLQIKKIPIANETS